MNIKNYKGAFGIVNLICDRVSHQKHSAKNILYSKKKKY